jgi:hypothetical protein
MPPVSAVGTLPLATLGGLRPRVDAFDARLLTFRARAADQAHAAFTPGTTWPVIGHPPGSSRENSQTPAFDATSILLTTPQQRTPAPGHPGQTLSGTSSWSPPDASSAPSPRSLTTTVFSQRSTGWFSAFPRRTTLEGQQASISSTAPPMNDVSYTTPPSAFVTHGCRINPRRNHWIASKAGLRKRPSRSSRAGRPSRGRRDRGQQKLPTCGQINPHRPTGC